MSFQVPNHYQIRYRDDIIMLAQQKESRLMRTVRQDPDELSGKAGYYDRMDAVEANEHTVKFQDITLSDVPLSRRRIILRDFDVYIGLDRLDKRRIAKGKALPEKYVGQGVKAMHRKQDDLIIASATGNAYSVDDADAAAAVALPAAQIIPVGAAGLTVAKVLAANEQLLGADIDEDEPRYAIHSAKQLTNLLGTTEVTSVDYNSVKALVEGKITKWMGFEWIRSERLTNDANGDRQCLFYTETAMGFAMGEEIDTDISPRLDKRGHPLQSAVFFSGDATRIEDEKIVVVPCLEA